MLPVDVARKRGAMAIFEEKYGDVVRMLTMTPDSVELCGGTHARSLGEIGLFKIQSEQGLAAGVRRIEAVTGLNALAYVREIEASLRGVSRLVKAPIQEVTDKVEKLLEREEAPREGSRRAQTQARLRRRRAADVPADRRVARRRRRHRGGPGARRPARQGAQRAGRAGAGGAGRRRRPGDAARAGGEAPGPARTSGHLGGSGRKGQGDARACGLQGAHGPVQGGRADQGDRGHAGRVGRRPARPGAGRGHADSTSSTRRWRACTGGWRKVERTGTGGPSPEES